MNRNRIATWTVLAAFSAAIFAGCAPRGPSNTDAPQPPETATDSDREVPEAAPLTIF